MKIAILLICGLMLSAGCTTTKIQQYVWDISAVPAEENKYEFSAKLNKSLQLKKEDLFGDSESETKTTLNVPTTILTPGTPAEVRIEAEGESPAIMADVLVQEQRQKTVITYSVSIKEDDIIHTTKGNIELSK